MTEIVALQLFLTDVLSPVACGERMSARAISRVDAEGENEQAARRARGHCAVHRERSRKNTMPETNWGRKETIIWPPHSPIYTFGAVFLALILTGLFVYLRFAFALSPLEQFTCRFTSRPPSRRAFASLASTRCCSCRTEKAAPGMPEKWMSQRARLRKPMPSPSRLSYPILLASTA